MIMISKAKSSGNNFELQFSEVQTQYKLVNLFK